MDQHKVVEIKFEDHYSLGDDWFDHVDESDLRILVCVGYLMKEDSKYYYVVNTYDTNNISNHNPDILNENNDSPFDDSIIDRYFS